MNISGNSTVSVEAAGSTQLKLKHPLAFKRKLAIYTGILALLLAIFTGMSLGIVNLTWQEVQDGLLGISQSDNYRVVHLIRMPRVICGALAGINLALAGCILQGILRNPLADPGIIGVTAGAGLFAMVVMIIYGERIIAENISLEVKQAEIISIIGPNGSGKSTLLRALGRLLPVNKGDIILKGKSINKMSEKDVARILAIMPQSADFPGDMTVRDLVTMGRMPYRGFLDELGKKDKEIVDKTLALTNLTHYQYRRVMSLSGGERQRVRLVLALAQEPEILLLDEPTTYLDIRHQLELMDLINRLHEELNLTVVMVLHDLNHAARYSDRIIALKDGKIIADGKVEDVFKEQLIRQLYGVENKIFTMEQAGHKELICLPSDVIRENMQAGVAV